MDPLNTPLPEAPIFSFTPDQKKGIPYFVGGLVILAISSILMYYVSMITHLNHRLLGGSPDPTAAVLLLSVVLTALTVFWIHQTMIKRDQQLIATLELQAHNYANRPVY